MDSKRTPIRTQDPDGTPIVKVPLAGGMHTAVIDAVDYDHLVALGFSSNWSYNAGANGFRYVRLRHAASTRNTLTVARLLMRPRAREIVKYEDGDALNLRRSNLYLDGGRAKAREEFAFLIAEARAAVMASQKGQALRSSGC